MNGQYDDIIDLPRPISKTRTPMSREARAAQFAPFAALTGYDAAIDETARLTGERAALDEEQEEALNTALGYIAENVNSHPAVTVCYFLPDTRKAGGKYVTLSGNVADLDISTATLSIGSKKINLDDIFSIEIKQ